jgi:hypothetical protein
MDDEDYDNEQYEEDEDDDDLDQDYDNVEGGAGPDEYEEGGRGEGGD